MFVLETVQPKTQTDTIFELKYPMITKLIGFSLSALTLMLLFLQVGQSTVSILVLLAVFGMFGVGLFLLGRDITVNLNKSTEEVSIKRSFLGIKVFTKVIPFADITDVYDENHWMGQTFQPKLHLYFKTKNGSVFFGIVNQKLKSDYIFKRIRTLLNLPEQVNEEG